MVRTIAAVVLAMLLGGTAGGQAGKIGLMGGGSSVPLAAGAVPPDAKSALLQMAAQAGVIFAGQVTAVRRNDAAGFVDITFAIQQAVRGCGGASSYVLREWAGLWSGNERYRAGDRRLMLLAARGAGGMSAPVGGMDGAIPLVTNATEPLADESGKAPADDGAGADETVSLGVDMRWIAARVLRGAGSQGVTRSGAKGALAVKVVGEPDGGYAGAGDTAGSWSGPAQPMNKIRRVDGGVGTVPVSLGFVLTLLRGSGGGS